LLLLTDEKTGMQILGRPFPTQPPQPGKPAKREFEYLRLGTRTMITSFVVATGEVVWDLGPTRTNLDFRAHVLRVAAHFPAMEQFDWVVDNLNTHLSLDLCEVVAYLCGLPFRPEARTAFLDDVAAERGMAPVGPADLAASPALAARLDPLLFRREGRWYGLAALTDVTDPAAVRDAVAGLGDPALAYVDLKAETEALVAGYTREAATAMALGGALLLAALAAALRRPAAVLRIAAPIASAVPVALALLGLLGVRLTLFHLAALLLMVGVSIDYALFLNRPPADADEDSRTLGSVLNCNATTLLTFGLLAFCRNPVLQGIGVTVASGVLAALIFAIGLSRPSASGGA
jgi:predicted exporter